MHNRPTRRRFLLLAAAAVAACRGGTSGAGRAPTYEPFRSTRIGTWWPEGRVTAVLVCLHGRNEDERFAFEEIGMHHYVERARLPFAVASVAGGAASYWHRRRDGSNAGGLVTDELVPHLLARQPDAVPVLVGWSMGGYGALLLAAQQPDRMPVAVAAAPALWRRAGDTPAGAFDDAADFAAHDVFDKLDALRRVKVRVDCGAEDPFATIDRQLLAALPDAEGGIRPGGHDSRTWRGFVPDQLAFVQRALNER